jgi:phosphoribosylformimino-5-aminoimidazole carboxamide ribonucleotide (ProFAR) isomerase
MKAPQKSLKKWTEQKWRTKSGKPSGETGERYLPEKAIKSLSSAEYAATTKAKREGTAKGKQFVKQPKSIAEKTRKFRAAEGGLAMNEGMKALKKAAPEVAKKMGYMKGGMTKKKMGYAKGGMVGASNPPTQKRTPKK